MATVAGWSAARADDKSVNAVDRMERLFRHCSVRAGKRRKITIDDHRFLPGQMHDRRHVRRSATAMPDNFTIFEGTSEIQRMIIGRAVTGLDVR
jgi:alkylation response protein AidB-like acyl-CoA dehydrogenase